MTEPPPARPAARPGLLLVLTLAWLAVWLLAAQFALPTVVAASVLAGATAGATATALLRGPRRPVPRAGLGALSGAVVGGLAALAIVLTHGTGSVATIFVGVVALAAMVGGVIGSPLPATIATAGLTAAFGTFLTDSLVYRVREPLINLFGGGGSDGAKLSAAGWFGLTQAVIGALVAGLIAFWSLRRLGRSAEEPPRWPGYLAAGAAAGGLLLVAEVITRLGSARLFSLAQPVSEFDRTVLGLTGNSRLNHALVVLFLGAVTALIAFGRTLPQRVDEETPEPSLVE